MNNNFERKKQGAKVAQIILMELYLAEQPPAKVIAP
jgi:hypothetical protein